MPNLHDVASSLSGRVRIAGLLGLLLAAAMAAVLVWPRPFYDEVDFNRDIRPILNDQCLPCHGGVKKQGGFSLLFEEDAFAPTESDLVAIVRGRPGSSELVRRLRHHDPEERMPYDAEPLSEEQIRRIERWIRQGAKWADHWAYRPVRPTDPPRIRSSWVRNDVDRFILARLREEKLPESPESDCATLARRVRLDLVGLPPTPSEVDALCARPSDQAYEAFVDSALASRHFGEHWAAMWLDLARYADTKGYEKDDHRDIWPYRDWVIEAFNADMPFDAFTIEQLAGDLLPEANEAQILATAFHRNTMTNDEGGTDDEEYRAAAVIDRVNTTFEVWQGTTMACTQCHGHPYDPFRHEDYFRLFAFFNNTEDNDSPDEAPTMATFGRSGGGGTAEAVQIPILRERSPDQARVTTVFDRGNYLSPTDTVLAGLPSVFDGTDPVPGQTRLDLARWLVSPENPLTARVTVNRIWARLFGRGLVETLEDFGTQGASPSHPELLDWLAHRFMHDLAWSQKRLLKELVLSATYRQSSHVRPDLLARDPENRLLARASRLRLSAEQIRDQALAVSGLLSGKMFGPSVMPPQPPGIWRAPYSGMQWRESAGEDRYRRAVYTYWRRTAPYPSMTTFDSPSREFCVSRRINTNTPLQALVTLNDTVYVEAARALADRASHAALGDIEQDLLFLYRHALQREPTAATIRFLRSLYEDALASKREERRSPMRTVATSPDGDVERFALFIAANAVMNLDAFVTRE